MKHNTYESVHSLLRQDRARDALVLFEQFTPENTVGYWMTKGAVEQKFQKWGEALNAYFKVLELDGQNQEAAQNIEIIRNILNFWNPEMFNP